jgi:hypothetical protein
MPACRIETGWVALGVVAGDQPVAPRSRAKGSARPEAIRMSMFWKTTMIYVKSHRQSRSAPVCVRSSTPRATGNSGRVSSASATAPARLNNGPYLRVGRQTQHGRAADMSVIILAADYLQGGLDSAMRWQTFSQFLSPDLAIHSS